MIKYSYLITRQELSENWITAAVSHLTSQTTVTIYIKRRVWRYHGDSQKP